MLTPSTRRGGRADSTLLASLAGRFSPQLLVRSSSFVFLPSLLVVSSFTLVTAVIMVPSSLWAVSALLPLISTANGLVFELVSHSFHAFLTCTDPRASVVSSCTQATDPASSSRSKGKTGNPRLAGNLGLPQLLHVSHFQTLWVLILISNCFSDGPNRALSAGYEQSNTMTIDTCVAYCNTNGYIYAGLEYSTVRVSIIPFDFFINRSLLVLQQCCQSNSKVICPPFS